MRDLTSKCICDINSQHCRTINRVLSLLYVGHNNYIVSCQYTNCVMSVYLTDFIMSLLLTACAMSVICHYVSILDYVMQQ